MEPNCTPMLISTRPEWEARHKKARNCCNCVWDNSGGLELAERFWDAAIAVDPEAKQTGDSVMDHQVRFQICGPPLVLRMLKQRP